MTKQIKMTEFNTKQQVASDKIIKFISQEIDNIFYLMGYAGTGKTFLIGKVIEKILLMDIIDHIFICAPTHKALKVIESYLKSNLSPTQPKISYMTIHKLLEFKPIIIAENGTKKFKSVKKSKSLIMAVKKLIIIDECSMISKEMMSELEKYVGQYSNKIIFIGDHKQLPPVGESESLVFTNVPDNYKFYILLDQIMRTKSTDIIEVCTIIRNWNKKDSLSKLILSVHNKNISGKPFRLYHKKNDYLQTTWFKHFIKKLDSGCIPIILTWKNSTSNTYNMMIRKHVHKSTDLDKYIINDQVIFNNFYTVPHGDTIFYTSDMVKILDIETKKIILFDWITLVINKPKTTNDKIFNTVLRKLSKQKNLFSTDVFIVEKIHSIVADIVLGKTYSVQTISKNDIDDYCYMLENVRKHIEFFFKKTKEEKLTQRLWNIFYTILIDPYAEINFGYSITIYKSQGSTFNSVMIDVDDVNELRNLDDLQKALYTAAGRASNELGLIIS